MLSEPKTKATAFDLLVKPIRRLIEQREFQSPSEPQEKTIPKILEGKNVLLIRAPEDLYRKIAQILENLDSADHR